VAALRSNGDRSWLLRLRAWRQRMKAALLKMQQAFARSGQIAGKLERCVRLLAGDHDASDDAGLQTPDISGSGNSS